MQYYRLIKNLVEHTRVTLVCQPHLTFMNEPFDYVSKTQHYSDP